MKQYEEAETNNSGVVAWFGVIKYHFDVIKANLPCFFSGLRAG